MRGSLVVETTVLNRQTAAHYSAMSRSFGRVRPKSERNVQRDDVNAPQSTVYADVAHSVARLEVMSRVGDDLSTGRMIRCLDTYDLGYKRSVLLPRELEELVLR